MSHGFVPEDKREWQAGQSAVIFALCLPVLLALAGLILDLGYAYGQHRFMQNAADAAVLHAVQEMAQLNFNNTTSTSTTVANQNKSSPPNSTYSLSIKYNNSQTANQSNGDWSPGPPTKDSRKVWAVASQTSPTFVMRLFGMSNVTVWAEAMATMYATSTTNTSMYGLEPICLEQQWVDKALVSDTVRNTKYKFWDGNNKNFSTYGEPADWKGLCNLDGTVAKDVQTMNSWVLYGYSGTVTLDEKLQAYNGNLGNNLSGDLYINLQSQNKYDDITNKSTQFGYIILPVIGSYTDDSPIGYFKVSSFLKIKVYLTDLKANEASGYFVNPVTDGAAIPGGVITSTTPITIKMTN